MSDITLAVGDGTLGSAEVSYGTDPRPPDSVSPGTDPLTAIAIQTLSQAVEMLREDVEHERDRADQAEHRVDELLHQLAETPERGLGADPMTAIGTQTLSQAVEMLREDVEHERDRADRAERQVEEEWDDPLISGIGWVSELVEIAGGMDMFADRSGRGAAKDRVVTFDEVIVQEPDLIIGSWCGKKFRPERVMSRPGFGSNSCSAAPGRVRDQIVADLAARSSDSDRWPGGNSADH